MFPSVICGLRTALLLLCIALLASLAFCAETIAVADSSGRVVANLPVLVHSAERMIPLRTLSLLCNWNDQQSDTECVVRAANGEAIFRLGNPFARVGSRIVQLRAASELWDGSYWIPEANLQDVFGATMQLAGDGNTLTLIGISVSQPPSTGDSVIGQKTGEKRALWSLGTIIVDPGHGGKDPGASGPPDWHEKTVTLDIARRLATLLEKNGLRAKLTRGDDEFVSLQRRTHFANENHGDLFLSIHCNSNRDKSVHGVEAYFLKPARTQRAIDVAMRENSVVKLEEVAAQYRDLTQENYILLSMATSQNMKDSETWAAQATARTTARCRLRSRGVDQAGFYVLMGAQMPAVLVECGYLSNASDMKVLASEQGRQAIAEALLTSILDMKTKLETAASR